MRDDRLPPAAGGAVPDAAAAARARLHARAVARAPGSFATVGLGWGGAGGPVLGAAQIWPQPLAALAAIRGRC